MNQSAHKENSKSSVNENQVKGLLAQHPDAPVKEILRIYNETADKKISKTTMFRIVRNLGPRQPKEKDLLAAELRLKVAQAYECGCNTKVEIAKLFNISAGTVAKYWRQYKKANNIDISTRGRSRKIPVNEAQIKEFVLQYPDATMEELRCIYNKTDDKKISKTTMGRIMSRLEPKLQHKKRARTEGRYLRAVKAYENKKCSHIKDTAKQFNISAPTLMKYWRKYKDVGSIGTATYQPDLKLWINNTQVEKLISQYPNASVSELCWHYNEATDGKISISAMSRVIRNLELKQKKRNLRAKDSCLKAIQAYASGQGTRAEIAKQFNVSQATLGKYWKQYREANHVLAKKHVKTSVDEAQIKKLVLRQPEASTKELCWQYNKALGKKISPSWMPKVIYRLGLKQKNISTRSKKEESLKAVKAYESGQGSQAEIAKQFNIRKETLSRRWSQYKKTNNIKTPIKLNKRKSGLFIDEAQIKEIILQQPNISIHKLCDKYSETGNGKICGATMLCVMRKLGFRQKNEKDLQKEEFRLKVAQAYANGDSSQKEIAKQFSISIATVMKYWKRYKKTCGKDLPIRARSSTPAVNKTKLKELILQYPDDTAKELWQRYNKEENKNFCLQTVANIVGGLGYKKKKKSIYAEEALLEAAKTYGKNLNSSSQAEVAKSFNIGVYAFKDYWQKYNKNNLNLLIHKGSSTNRRVNEAKIRELALKQPDASVKELWNTYNDTANKKIHETTMYRTIKRLRLKQQQKNIKPEQAKEICLKAIEAYKKGEDSQQKVARQFGIAPKTFSKYWKQYQEANDAAHKLRPRSLYTKELWDKVIQTYAKGIGSQKEIAKLFNISPMSVAAHWKKYKEVNDPTYKLTPKRCIKELSAKVAQAYINEGKSQKEIAELFNISPSTVSRYCRQQKSK